MSECIICCDDNENVFHKLSCGHEFHYKCILDWVESKYGNGIINCPVCREEVKAKGICLHKGINYNTLKEINKYSNKELLLTVIKNTCPESLESIKNDEKDLVLIQKYCPLLYCYLTMDIKTFDIVSDIHFKTLDAVNYNGIHHLLERQSKEDKERIEKIKMEARIFLNSCPSDIIELGKGFDHLIEMGLTDEDASFLITQEIQKRETKKQMEEERNLPVKRSKWVRNPITGRAIKRYGTTYKKVMIRTGYSDNDFRSLY